MAGRLDNDKIRRQILLDAIKDADRDPFVVARKKEEEKRAQEERVRQEIAAARTPSLDSFGSLEGMLEALNRPSPEPQTSPQEEKVATPGTRWQALVSQLSGGSDLETSYDIFDELGDLETKYNTPEKREVAKSKLVEDANFYSRDRSTFNLAAKAHEELARIAKAEELFSDPAKLASMKEEISKLQSRGRAKSQAAEAYYNRTGNYGIRTLGDVAGSWKSAGSIVGGIAGGALAGPVGAGTGALAGSVPSVNDARQAAYYEARQGGMTEEQAREFSLVMGGSEMVLDVLGQGGAAALSGLLKREVKKRVVDGLAKTILTTTAKQAGLGYLEEGGTQALQQTIAGFASIDDQYNPQAQQYLRDQANINKDGTLDWKKSISDINRAGMAGLITTGIVGSGAETLSTVSEMGKQASRLQDYLRQQKFNKEAFDANRINQATSDFLTNRTGDEVRSNAIDVSRFDGVPTTDPTMQAAAEAAGSREALNAFLTDPTGATPRTPVLDREPLKGQMVGNPDPAFKKATQEAEKLVTDKAKSIAQAEKRKAAKAEKDFKDRLVTESMKLPEGDRVSFVRERLEAYRAQNAPKPAAAGPVAPTPVDENTPSVPISQLSDALQNAPEGSVALPSVAPTSGTGVTLQDVGKAVGGGKRDKLASRLSYMVEDGNLEIVQSQDQIPGEIGKMQQQGKGWYDPESGKTYLVAGNLDSKNIKGDILSTLAHETKHAGDFGGSAGLAKSFKSFIGAEANSRLAAKIREAAGKGDKSAEATMNRINKSYQGQGLTQDQMNSEIVANYITTEGKKSGARTALYRSVVSPLRTGAKKLLRSNDVSLGDIHYMADRLVSEVAQRGERIEGGAGGIALPSILGEQATGFNQAEQENRVYTSKDGSRRFVISDKAAKVNPSGLAKLVNGGSVKLGDMVDHGELYSNYENMPNSITVKLAPPGANYGAMAVGNNILVARETAALAMLRPATFKGIMLHEMQHVVQDAEGHSPGGMPENFLGDEARSAIRNGKAKVGGLKLEASALIQPGTLEAVSIEDAAALQSIADGIKKDKIDAFSGMAQATDILSRYSDRNLVKLTERLLNKTEDAMNAWESKTQAEQQAQTDYLNMLGETDARFTENNADLPLEELPVNPETGYNANVSVEPNDSPRPPIVRRMAPMPSMADTEGSRKGRSRLASKSKPFKYGDEWIVEYTLVTDGRRKSYGATADNVEEADAKADRAIERHLDKQLTSTPMPSVVEQGEEDNRSWWNKTKDSEERAATAWIARAVDDVFSTTEGFGKNLFKVLDQRQGLRADLSLRAETLGSQMERGIRAAAKERNTTLNKISTELEHKLTEINKLESMAERQAAVKELDNIYPEVGTALNGLRNLKWSLARRIMEQRKAQGGDLTLKEQKIYGKIIENAETYTTRAYLSNQMPGKKFAKRRLSDIKKNPKGDEAIRYNEAIKFLIDNHLAIPSLEEMQSMEGKDIRKFYENYFGDSTGLSVTQMAEKLDNYPRKQDYNKEAVKIAKELMGLKRATSTVARGYGGARQNRTILEGREKVPDEIRFLMGEITNPLAAEMMSVARLVNLYTQTNMLQKMVEEGKGTYYKDYKEGDFNHQLKGEAYGPMQGKWVTPTGRKFIEPAVEIGLDVEQALSAVNKDATIIGREILKKTHGAVQGLTSAVKLADLVTSLAAMGWNYFGAYGIVVANGANPKYIAKAHRNTANAIRSHYGDKGFSEEQLADIQELLRARVLDSATVGEFQQSFYKNMFRFLEDEQIEGNKSVMIKVQRAIDKGVIAAKDGYAFMDMWAKVAAYYDRKDFLTKYYKANGDSKSNEDIIRQAGQDITAANISYTRAIKLFKTIERNVPNFAMYLTYFSEVPRSLVSNMMLAVRDLRMAGKSKTSEARNLAIAAGSKRAVGTLTVTAVLSYFVNMYLNSLSDDEERRRNTDPEWEQTGTPLPLGKTTDNKKVTMNGLRLDAYGPLNEFTVRMAQLGPDDSVADALVETIKSQFVEAKPVTATWRLLQGLAGRATENYEDDHGEWADALDKLSWGEDKNLGRNLASVLEGFTPKMIKGTYRTLTGTIGNRHYEFDPVEQPAIALAQAMGVTPVVRDPEFSLEMATSKYRKAKTKANDELTTLKKRLGKYDGKELIGEFKDIVEDEEKAYNDLYKVYDGTKAFNGYYTDKDYAKAADAIIKDAKLGSVGSDVARNSFNVRFISPKYVNEWRDARIQVIKEMKDPKEKSLAMANLRKEYKMVWDYLGNANKRKE